MKRINWKTLIVCAVLIMASVFAVLAIVRASDGLTNTEVSTWSLRKVNGENLWQAATFNADKNGVVAGLEGSGVSLNLDDDHVLKVSAAKTHKTAVTVAVATVTLPAGKAYVINPQANASGTNDTFYISVKSGDTELKRSYGTAVYLDELASDTTITVEFYLAAEVGAEITMKPLIYAGNDETTPISFYK